MKAGANKKGQVNLKRFSRFKLEAGELHSIKGGSYHIFFKDGEWHVVWVDD